MSATIERMDRTTAIAFARAFVAEIEPCTDQLIVAGSLRRRLATIGDIEVVCVPRVETLPIGGPDLFGDVKLGGVDMLDLHLTMLLDKGRVQKRPRSDGQVFWGPRAKYLTFQGARVDLFCAVNDWDKEPPRAEPERFGWILMLRTGPYKFSKQLVVPKGKRTNDGRPGLMPAYIRAGGDLPHQKGWLTYRTSGGRIPTPTEKDVFELFGLPYREPWERI